MTARRDTTTEAIDARAFIEKVKDVAAITGILSGTGGMELAGMILSSLAANPEHLSRFMSEGSGLLIDGTITFDNGCLSFRAINGTINTPADLRRRKGQQQ
jgi:hypothetical protein